MTRFQVFAAQVPAAALAGAGCAFVYLAYYAMSEVVSDGADLWGNLLALVAAWLFFGIVIGLMVAGLAAIVPVVVATAVWTPVQARWGTRRAMVVVSLLIGLVSVAEGIVAIEGGQLEEPWAWSVVAGVVSGLASWCMLRLVARLTRATPVPARAS